MRENINHSGYINLKENRHYAYDLNDGKMTIHMYEPIPEIDGNKIILGTSFTSKMFAMIPQLPLNIGRNHPFPINYSFQLEWLIENYKVGSKIKEVNFSFDELQYFCLSAGIVEEENGQRITFKREPIVLREFSFEYFGHKCNAAFKAVWNRKTRVANSYMQAESILCINFDETEDWEFVYKIYKLVDAVFSFICNRRNTDCTYMDLRIVYPDKTVDGIDCIHECISQAYFFDKYREKTEGSEAIGNAALAPIFLMHIDALFALIAKDSENGGSDSATISIASIHPSTERRRLIDLQQSLHITGAFEFYVRKYLPSMIEEKEYHMEMRKLLQDISKDKTYNKKVRKLASSLEKNIVREPALKDKILKAYYGFKEWSPLKSCIDKARISEEEVKELASEANAWRNELAHSKRLYEPSVKTIKAVRLMEHLNYAIIFREIGYADEEILDLLNQILEY